MKKKLTAIFDGDKMPDLTALLQVALEFKIDTIDGPEAVQPTRAIHRPGGGQTRLTTIMDHYGPELAFERHTAIKWLTAEGYAETTISSALQPLIKERYVQDLGAGKYKFLKPFPAK